MTFSLPFSEILESDFWLSLYFQHDFDLHDFGFDLHDFDVDLHDFGFDLPNFGFDLPDFGFDLRYFYAILHHFLFFHIQDFLDWFYREYWENRLGSLFLCVEKKNFIIKIVIIIYKYLGKLKGIVYKSCGEQCNAQQAHLGRQRVLI